MLLNKFEFELRNESFVTELFRAYMKMLCNFRAHRNYLSELITVLNGNNVIKCK